MNFARVVSLLLFIAFSAEWLRSYLSRVPLLEFSDRDGRRWQVISGKGLLSLSNWPQVWLEEEQDREARDQWRAERRRIYDAEASTRKRLQAADEVSQLRRRGLNRIRGIADAEGFARERLRVAAEERRSRRDRQRWLHDLADIEAAKARLGATPPNLQVTMHAERYVHYAVPVAATAILPAAWLWAGYRTRWREDFRILHGLCVRCGYDLRGNRGGGGTCPECGAGRGPGR